jgi:RNA polymerase sigma factor (sigma-70 family)
MMRTSVSSSPRELQSLLRDGIATGLTDQELLERFATCRDHSGEIAFATLVARHGPMVMNVCRRMLRNPADADDAFQATFLVLVRRAGAIRLGTSLGPWLYGVSVRVARRARDQGARHRAIELNENSAETMMRQSSPVNRDLKLAIDEALARLPANFRAAIVSCYLEGLTHEEAAVRLRCPVGTVRSRLARGRALLRGRLERSGLAPEVGRCDPLAMLGLERARWVVAPHLVDSTARTAARLAAGQPLAAIVPARLAQLVAGACPSMTIFKLTLATALAVAAGLAAWGAVALAEQGPGGNAPASPPSETRAHPLLALAAVEAPHDSSEAKTQREKGENQPEPAVPDDLPPVVVNIEPAVGARDVDPGLRELRVTFSKKMRDKNWSWTEGNVYSVPKLDGTVHYEYNQRTCVMPVKLEPGKTYVLGINSERFRNFKDVGGQSALPYLMVFHTKAAK